MNREPCRKKTSGFSIIELSIVIAVLSFIVVNTLLVKDMKKDQRKIAFTTERMESIKNSLNNYVQKYGRYPCPADGKAAVNATTYGKGIVDPDPRILCKTSLEDDTLGIFRVSDPTYNNGFGDMVFGVVPVQDLGLPSSYALDEWGRRIGYGVLQRFTATSSYSATLDGDIQIMNENGALDLKTAYVIISYGKNGIGAWPFAGGSNIGRIPSPTSPTTYVAAELDNNHLDDNAWDKQFFRRAIPSPNTEGNRMLFDDILMWAEPDEIKRNTESLDGSPFSPDHIPGLVLWLDARDPNNDLGNTIPEEEVLIEWKDKTRAANNAIANNASSDNAPRYIKTESVFGNRPAVRFTENQYLKIEDEASLRPQKITVFAAAGYLEGSKPNILFEKYNPESGSGWSLNGAQSNDKVHFWPNVSANESMVFSDGASRPFIVTATFDPSVTEKENTFIYLGCNPAGSTRYAGIGPEEFANSTAERALFIGNRNENGELVLSGDMGEILIYDTILSDYDRGRVARYLSARWGIEFESCDITAMPQCESGQVVGTECGENDSCCSKNCKSTDPNANRCCVPNGPNHTAQFCTQDSDCCDNAARCAVGGYCWVVPGNTTVKSDSQ